MQTFLGFWLVRIFILIALGQFLSCTAFNCSSGVRIGKRIFDLSSLDQKWTYSNTTTTYPTQKITTYYINICKALTPDENEGKDTSCEAGTNICEIITHISNNNTKMITSIRSIKDFKNATQIKLFKSDINNNESLEVILEGKDSDNVNQSVNITFFIGHTENSEPIVKEYKDNKLYIEWNIEGPSVTDDDSKGWSPFTIFLFLIFVGFLGYLLIGIVYNHQTYNSHGWDLLPHRDFWRSVPYMLSDLSKNILNYISGHYRGYSQV